MEQSDPTRAFAMQARDYCSFVEGTSDGETPRAFARECLVHLSSLYQLALRLPNVAPAHWLERESIPDDRFYALMKSIADRLPQDLYWMVLDPLDMTLEDQGVGSLADDLADTWRDLKPGVEWMAVHGGEHLPDGIIWNWRWTFEYHWGWHASSAMAILHPMSLGMPCDPGEEPSSPS